MRPIRGNSRTCHSSAEIAQRVRAAHGGSIRVELKKGRPPPAGRVFLGGLLRFPGWLLLAMTLVDYTKLRRDLVTVVARICPRWPAARRDDLVQAAVMRIMHVFGAGGPDVETEGTSAPRASYLYKVAHSVLVDELRRIRRQRETSTEEGTLESIPAVRADPERLAVSRQIGEGIRDCLSRLKRERRIAVTLYLQGHTVPQSARIVDWSIKRTENLVYRGLAELRECLTSKGIRL